MTTLPPISIVVPVMEPSKHLADALQSLEEQDYPALEVIVESGEPGGSHTPAELLNRGFARASGDIRGYLRPDELLLPGALHLVAAEIAAERGRHVVMGRSLFLVEGMEDVGVEHPGEYLGYFDHLAVWKRGFNAVPQASVFWHRAVAERCGAFAGEHRCAVDYDFICRVARSHSIHPVDCVWSARRLPADASSARMTEAEKEEMLVRVSRTHWGSWLSPLRWRCEFSHWLHHRHLHENARHHARQGEKAAVEGRCFVATVEFLKTWLLSPAMARARWKGCRRAS